MFVVYFFTFLFFGDTLMRYNDIEQISIVELDGLKENFQN
jgi:hypothetical protein